MRFFKEDITFTLNSGNFIVDGYYWFSNESNKELEKMIFYPFGCTDSSEAVDSVTVFNMTNGVAQNILQKNENGLFFVVFLSVGDTTIYHITYRQSLTSDSVRYFLRSTQQWGKPLESAQYKLVVHNPVIVTKYSYEPDTLYTIQGDKIYYWNRRKFLPEADLVFHYKLN